MMRLILLFVCLTTSLLAQAGNTVILRFAGVPAGSCAPIMLAVNNANGNLYDCQAGAWNLVGPGAGVGAHNFLSATHSDSLASSPVLGGIVAANATPAWAQVTGNTTTTKQFLTQTGTGAVSALPAWAVIVDADVPATITRDSEVNVQGTANEITSSGSGVAPTLSIAAVLNLSTKVLSGGSPLVFEGATPDAFETTLVVTEPTAPRTLTVPNADSAAVQPLTCSGTDKVSGVSTLGVITCSADVDTTAAHNLLSATHTDTAAASAVLGDILAGNVTPAWQRVAGNTTTAKQFLTQTGTGAVSALPAWAAIVDGDVPAAIARDAEINVQGTANEITSSGAGVAPVLSLSASLDVSGKEFLGGSPFRMEGTTNDNVYVTVVVTDPTLARTFTLPNADSVAVQPDAGAANQFLTAISTLGVISKAQPAFSNLSGSATLAQLPFGTANQVLGTNAGATAIEHKSLATGTTGTDFAIAHAANSVTFNLPSASATVRGALLSADWTTFNNSVDSVSGTASEIGSTGGQTPVISLAAQLALSGKELLGGSPIQFEGTTDDNVYTTIVVTDPTLARTFTLPNANSVAVQPLTCSGSDKVSAVSALGVVACSADVSGGTPAWESLVNSADTATSYTSNNTAETVTFSFESAFGASQQFLIRQQTGNPTAGTLLDVRAADAQVTVFRAGDGTNGITVSQTGALTAEGTGSITATLGDSATSFWAAGQCEAARGCTGDDTSGTTGVPRITAGNWTYDAGISHLAASTSADLLGVLNDETGTGVAVFGTSPTITTSLSQDGDAADAGYLRLQNAATIGWEASPAGTDITLTVDTSEVMQASGTFNAVTLTESGNAVPNATDNLSFFAATTSLQLLGVISDEVGSGALVFGTSPTITTSLLQDGDVADAGYFRLQNAAIIGWEASPAGTDITFSVDASEIFQFSSIVNVTTGLRVGGAATTGNYLRGDGTNFISAAIVHGDLPAVDRTRQIMFIVGADNGAVIVDGDDQATIYMNRLGQGITITEVQCESDAGSPIINLQRDDGSPANILSSNLTCSTSGATGTIDTNEDNVANTERIDYLMITAGGTAKRITVAVKFVVD